MNWLALILASVLLNSVATVLQRVVLREEKSDPVAYSIFFQLLTGLLIGGFGVVTSGLTFPDLRPLALFLILMTFLYGFGNIFIFQALKAVEASKFTVIFSGRALFTILASTLFIREPLTQRQWPGAILILLGVIIVNLQASRISLKKEDLIALLAAASFGFANTNDRFLLRSFSLYPYVFLAFIVPALFILSLHPRKIKEMAVFLEKKLFVRMLILCIAYAAAAITFFSALQIAPSSSQVATINLTSVIVTVLLALLILKERKNTTNKVIGALISFFGLVLVS
ncbi:DMT family transporter [Candidatus Shapirobacteria bacterium]|nr:DMT family transporter [Candidatus Shapirobacteria bacterium]